MRALVLAAALAFAPTAWAQVTYSPPAPAPPLGGFSLGMSEREARAVLPDAAWDGYAEDDRSRVSIRSRTRDVSLSGLQFYAQLAFTENAAALVRLDTEVALSPEGCRDQHRAMVEEAMLTRAPFTQRDNWFVFYHDPDAPRGHVEGDTFVPAPNTPVYGVAQTVRDPRVQFDSVILEHNGSAQGQMYYLASGSHGKITAHSITRGNASVCRIVVSLSQRATAPMPTPERLAERLAAAELIRPPVYVDTPSAWEVQRYYPARAMDREVEGMAQLSCLVLADGALACVVLMEEPIDFGFGEAALRIVRGYRIDTFAIAPGNRVNIVPRFMLPD